MKDLLRRLFGRDDKFFTLLEASAVEAQKSIQLLVEMMNDPEATRPLDEVRETRRKGKRISEEISEELCKTFVTPMEREDIEALSIALNKIAKTVDRFSEKYILCQNHVCASDFTRQIAIIEQAAETVVEMVKRLRTRAHLEETKEQNDRLHRLEAEADKLMMDLLKDLYCGKHPPLKVIVVLDMHETLEEIVDRYRDAGNVIFQIVLKYS